MLKESPDGVLLAVRAVPGAKKSEITGEEGGRLRVRLNAPPVEGKANKELLKLLVRELGLKKSQVSLTRGDHAREKTVLLAGVSLSLARERLKTALHEE